MHTRTNLALAAAGLALALTACGSGDDAVADCRAALEKQAQDFIDTGTGVDVPPPACTEVDATTLQRLTNEVLVDVSGIDEELEDAEIW